MCAKEIKNTLNTLDEAAFVRDVDKSAYHGIVRHAVAVYFLLAVGKSHADQIGFGEREALSFVRMYDKTRKSVIENIAIA